MAGGMRFGVVFADTTNRDGWVELARRVEGEGFASLLVADHYTNDMACGPLIMAAAAATTTLRVGSYVYDNDFRHPALLAKEAATIDVLSGGRLELGIGAGWDKEEYDQVGIPFDASGVRISRMEEALDVIEALFAGGPVHHDGAFYRLNGFEGLPRPVQRPIPLMIGGGGPRMLTLAARRAATVALVPRSLPGGGIDPTRFGQETFAGQIEHLEAAVTDAGRTDRPPERSLLLFNVHASVDDVPRGSWIAPDELAASPYGLLGEPGAMADSLVERHERFGIDYFVCFEDDLETFLPVVRRLAS